MTDKQLYELTKYLFESWERCADYDNYYMDCQFVLEALAEQPAPLLDLDSSTGFTFFDRENGSTFIGEVEMLKWLVENRSKDYWEHAAKEGTRK